MGMTDIDKEKVIKGLECCISEGTCEGCPEGCPYKEQNECIYSGYYHFKAIEDALALLKEQETVVRCKDCKYWEEHHKWVRPEGGSYIAPRCNRLMKKTRSNWFCADGEVSEMDKKCKQCEYFDYSYDVCKHPCGSRSYDDVGEEDVCEQFTNKQNSMTHEEAIPFIDREKVIRGLECLAQKQKPIANPCKDCGYINRPNFAICVKDVAADALALLKAHEPKTILNKVYSPLFGVLIGTCPFCGEKIMSGKDSQTRFCRYCRQEVVWDD